MDVPISSIVINGRHRKDMGDIEALAESIGELGLLQPIVLASDGKTLVAGARRIAAFRHLGREKIPAYVAKSIDDLYACLRGEQHENTCRKSFTPSEADNMADAVQAAEDGLAKQRQAAAGAASAAKFNQNIVGARRALPANGGKRSSKDKRESESFVRSSRASGLSPTTRRRIKEVKASGNAAWIAEMDRTGNVNRAYRKVRVATATHDPTPLPPGVFDLILADPPWKYDFAETETREIENQYKTMAVAELARLKIPAATDAVLFMWATAPKLREAFDVMDAWGFMYRTHAVWDKEKLGMGYWFRGQHELLLVGTRGKFRPPPENARASSVIRSPRARHSEKPVAAYELIERMFPACRKLELFSRKPREGWTAWGNQV